jgi:tRNA wybutosine-synthesizing protein 3
MVPPSYLWTLLRLTNQRFTQNVERTERFRRALLGLDEKVAEKVGDGPGGQWEDAEVRRERKRAEGLRRREEVLKAREEAEREKQGGEVDGEVIAAVSQLESGL